MLFSDELLVRMLWVMKSVKKDSVEIVVCIKPVCYSPVQFRLSGQRIDPGSSHLAINEVDEYALEEALAIKSQFGGSVTAISVGGLVHQDALYLAKAKGVDRAIRVEDNPAEPLLVSANLAKVISEMHFDMIFTGTESFDCMSGQTGIYLAERLGLPFAYAVIQIIVDVSSNSVIVKKELGNSSYQMLQINLPAVFCIQSGIRPLKYTAPARLMRARREPIEAFSSLAMEGKSESDPVHISYINIFKPERDSKCEMLEGQLDEIALSLMKKILEGS